MKGFRLLALMCLTAVLLIACTAKTDANTATLYFAVGEDVKTLTVEFDEGDTLFDVITSEAYADTLNAQYTEDGYVYLTAIYGVEEETVTEGEAGTYYIYIFSTLSEYESEYDTDYAFEHNGKQFYAINCSANAMPMVKGESYYFGRVFFPPFAG